MKKMLKRVLVMMLAGVLAICSVACGGGKNGSSNSTDQNVNGGKTDDTVVDLEGYEFTIASQFIQDEPDLEVIMGSERSFEEARQYVEDTYNCKITIKYFEPTIENMRAKIMSGDKIADVIHIPINYLLQSIRAGYVQCMGSWECVTIRMEFYSSHTFQCHGMDID